MRLTKEEFTRLFDLSEKCDELQTELIDAIQNVRDEVLVLLENEVDPARRRFNDAVSDLEDEAAKIAGRLEGEAENLEDEERDEIDAMIEELRSFAAELNSNVEVEFDDDAGIEDHVEQSFELPDLEVE